MAKARCELCGGEIGFGKKVTLMDGVVCRSCWGEDIPVAGSRKVRQREVKMRAEERWAAETGRRAEERIRKEFESAPHGIPFSSDVVKVIGSISTIGDARSGLATVPENTTLDIALGPKGIYFKWYNVPPVTGGSKTALGPFAVYDRTVNAPGGHLILLPYQQVVSVESWTEGCSEPRNENASAAVAETRTAAILAASSEGAADFVSMLDIKYCSKAGRSEEIVLAKAGRDKECGSVLRDFARVYNRNYGVEPQIKTSSITTL